MFDPFVCVDCNVNNISLFLSSVQCHDRVTVIAATNLPDQLDDAIVRRLVSKVYVGPPDEEARRSLIVNSLNDREKGVPHSLKDEEIKKIVEMLDGKRGIERE